MSVTVSGGRIRVALANYVILPSGIGQVTIEISAAQILSLHTTPVLLISSPGPGKYLAPIQVEYIYTFVTTAYTRVSSAAMILAYNGTTAAGMGIIGTVMTQSNDALATTSNQVSFNGVNQNLVVDKGLYLAVNTGSFTLGDSTLKVKVLYHIVTI